MANPLYTNTVSFCFSLSLSLSLLLRFSLACSVPEPTPEHWIQPPERKVWHPIVWQQPPPPIPPDVYGKDAPHQRLIKNIRRLLVETKAKPEERQKHIEHMMLSLPSGPRPKSDDDEEEEPKPVPKPKKKKRSKKNGKGRKRTESETSDDSISHKISVSATRSKTILEEP